MLRNDLALFQFDVKFISFWNFKRKYRYLRTDNFKVENDRQSNYFILFNTLFYLNDVKT